MKSALNMWSYSGPKGDPDAFEAFLELTKDVGFDAVEPVLTNGPITIDSSDADVEAFRRMVEDTGLEIASLALGFYWQHSLTADDAATRAKAVEMTKRAARITHLLGTDAMLVLPGAVVTMAPNSPVVPYDVCYTRSQEELRKALPAAREQNVAIALENVWNKFLLSPLEMRDFVDELADGMAGVYFDVGNIVAYGYPEQWIRILGERIVRVHLKDFKRSVGTIDGFCPLGEGDVDWPEVKKALNEVGYDSYLTCEIGAVSEDELRRAAAFTRELCG